MKELDWNSTKMQEGIGLIAVVTGASSGLGSEYVRLLDTAGVYREIWVIARRKDRLERLQAQVGTPLRILTYDLSDRTSIDRYEAMLAETKPIIGLLINAAGFGKIGRYDDIPRAEIDNMIDLNCRAAVDMTQASLPYMIPGCHIMEICSTAGFQPFPYLNVYAASKAFLYRYSRALGVELEDRGISVTAVCPYWIKDTEFIGTAQKTKDSSKIAGFPFSSKVSTVAKWSLSDAMAGFPVSTPGPVCTAHRFFAKCFPDRFLMNAWELIRRI